MILYIRFQVKMTSGKVSGGWYSLEGGSTDGVPGGAVRGPPVADAVEVEVRLVVVLGAEVLALVQRLVIKINCFKM